MIFPGSVIDPKRATSSFLDIQRLSCATIQSVASMAGIQTAPSLAHILNAWSAACGSPSEDCTHCSRWSLVSRRESVGVNLWRWYPLPTCLLHFPVCCNVKVNAMHSSSLCQGVSSCHACTTETDWDLLKSWNPSFLCCSVWYSITAMPSQIGESWKTMMSNWVWLDYHNFRMETKEYMWYKITIKPWRKILEGFE